MKVATLGQGTKVLELVNQKEVSSKRLQYLLDSGLIADLLDSKGDIDRTEFQKVLGLLRQADGSTQDGSAPAQTFLRRVAKMSLPEQAEPFNPYHFFQTRKGLLVCDGVLPHVRPPNPLQSFPTLGIELFDLISNANDQEIMSELTTSHIFDEDVFWSHLAGMVERQWNGEEGPLLTNGYANIFYVRDQSAEVFRVGAERNADNRRWEVFAYPLNARQWREGVRAFSRSC